MKTAKIYNVSFTITDRGVTTPEQQKEVTAVNERFVENVLRAELMRHKYSYDLSRNFKVTINKVEELFETFI